MDFSSDINLQHQQDIIDFIQSYRATNQVSPTLSEIAAHIYGNPKGFGNAKLLVDHLIAEGFLRQVAPSRGLIVCDPLPREFYYRKEKTYRKFIIY